MGRAMPGLRRLGHHRRGGAGAAAGADGLGPRDGAADRCRCCAGRAAGADRVPRRRPRARRWARAGVGLPARRGAGHRQVHAAAAPRRPSRVARARVSARERRGIAAQVAARARRLGIPGDAVRFAPGRDLERVLDTARAERPFLLAVDSIQTIRDTSGTQMPGGVVAGANVHRRPRRPGQDRRHRRTAHRPRHEGRRPRRAARARARGRRGAHLRRRCAVGPADARWRQEPFRRRG